MHKKRKDQTGWLIGIKGIKYKNTHKAYFIENKGVWFYSYLKSDLVYLQLKSSMSQAENYSTFLNKEFIKPRIYASSKG